MKIKFLPLSFVFFFCAVSVALADGAYNQRGSNSPGIFNDIITKGPWVDVRAYGTALTDTIIQSAINSASGKCVVFDAQTYIFSSMVNGIGNICLVGRGKGITIFKTSNGANLTTLVNFSSISNVSVSGITFDGNKANNTTVNSGLLNFSSSTNISVYDNEFRNAVGSAGISGVCLGFSSTGNSDVKIEGNWFHNCGTTTPLAPADGVYYGGSNAKIIGNIFENITDTPIVWESQSNVNSSPNNNVTISNNIISYSSNGVAISTLSLGGLSYLTNFAITNNVFYSTNYYTQVGNNSAINIVGGTLGRLYGGIISGNTISGTLRSNGIITKNASNIDIVGNQIYNVYTDSGNAYGMRLNTSNNLKATNNLIDNYIGAGIYALGLKYSDVSNNQIFNSTTSAQGYALSFWNDAGPVTSDTVSVNNNTIRNATNGILLADDSTNMSLTSNYMSSVTNRIVNGTSGVFGFVDTSTANITTNMVITSTLATGTPAFLLTSTTQNSGNWNQQRLYAGTGSPLASGNISLSPNWGTTSLYSVTGNDTGFGIQIYSSGTGQANPGAFTVTFKDGAFNTASTSVCNRADQGVQNTGGVSITNQSAAGFTANLGVVPSVGNTYFFNCITIGR